MNNMLKMHVIASGSKGNAAVIYNENTHILVDLGITKKRLVEGLKEINLTIKDIDALLITHNHSDHIKNIKFIDKSKHYSLKGVTEVDENHNFQLFQEFKIKDISILPLKTSHDTERSCGFLFKYLDEELVYLTDTGIIPLDTYRLIKNKDYYFIESNHDIGMLLRSNRTITLINRILSYKGHLSNEQCAYYLMDLIGSRTKKVILAHISEDCNSIKCIDDTFNEIFMKEEVYFPYCEFIFSKQHESVSI